MELRTRGLLSSMRPRKKHDPADKISWSLWHVIGNAGLQPGLRLTAKEGSGHRKHGKAGKT